MNARKPETDEEADEKDQAPVKDCFDIVPCLCRAHALCSARVFPADHASLLAVSSGTGPDQRRV